MRRGSERGVKNWGEGKGLTRVLHALMKKKKRGDGRRHHDKKGGSDQADCPGKKKRNLKERWQEKSKPPRSISKRPRGNKEVGRRGPFTVREGGGKNNRKGGGD